MAAALSPEIPLICISCRAKTSLTVWHWKRVQGKFRQDWISMTAEGITSIKIQVLQVTFQQNYMLPCFSRLHSWILWRRWVSSGGFLFLCLQPSSLHLLPVLWSGSTRSGSRSDHDTVKTKLHLTIKQYGTLTQTDLIKFLQISGHDCEVGSWFLNILNSLHKEVIYHLEHTTMMWGIQTYTETWPHDMLNAPFKLDYHHSHTHFLISSLSLAFSHSYLFLSKFTQ